MLLIFRSAEAFFFLFFLHGTSIGPRQQGISYNVLRLSAVPHITNLIINHCTPSGIAPNRCYTLFVLIFCAVGINH